MNEVSQRMTEQEYQALKLKIETEFPIRLKLAELAGRPKINPKHFKVLEEFDDSIADLFLEISLGAPAMMIDALDLIRTIK